MLELGLKRAVRLQAPAKLNLGLEVLGRRPDGLHEIVTVLQAVGPGDAIELRPAQELSYTPLAGETAASDLVARALELARTRLGISLRAEVLLEKGVPAAAGLGGGSGDAGTLLGALARLAGLPPAAAAEAAAELGADVPFFVRGGTALAQGTGRELEPLPEPVAPLWFVVAVPELTLPNKTRMLYGALRPDDYGNGRRTLAQAERRRAGLPLDPRLLTNAFARPLFEYAAVRAVATSLRHAGAELVVPSGAGPALFTVTAHEATAGQLAARIPESVARVLVYRSLPAGVNDAALAELVDEDGVERRT